MILKAKEGLTAKKVTVTRGGKTYQTTVYVRGDKKKKSPIDLSMGGNMGKFHTMLDKEYGSKFNLSGQGFSNQTFHDKYHPLKDSGIAVGVYGKENANKFKGVLIKKLKESGVSKITADVVPDETEKGHYMIQASFKLSPKAKRG